MNRFRLIHIDAVTDASSKQSSSASAANVVTFDSWSKADKESQDPICAIAASDSILLIGRASGIIQRYSLPKLVFQNKIQADIRAYSLYINCNSTLVCLIYHLHLHSESSQRHQFFLQVF